MSCMQSETEREQRRVDKLITRQLREDKRSLKHELKLLLLGVLMIMVVCCVNSADPQLVLHCVIQQYVFELAQIIINS